MAIEVFDRIEKKFLLTEEKYNQIIDMMQGRIIEDEHSQEGAGYSICNVYYDTPSDDLIAKSIEKPVYKEKLRLRSYGAPGLDDKVFLEIKKKFKGRVTKRRIVITLAEAYAFLEKGERPKTEINNQIFNELCYFTQVEYNLVPKLFISYDRKAFFGAEDNELRITFDSNIRSRTTDLRLDAGIYGEPLLKENMYLMEIKCLHAVPMWLAGILSECEIYTRSFSKYGTIYQNSHQNKINYYNQKGDSECLNQYLNRQQQNQDLQCPQHLYV